MSRPPKHRPCPATLMGGYRFFILQSSKSDEPAAYTPCVFRPPPRERTRGVSPCARLPLPPPVEGRAPPGAAHSLRGHRVTSMLAIPGRMPSTGSRASFGPLSAFACQLAEPTRRADRATEALHVKAGILPTSAIIFVPASGSLPIEKIVIVFQWQASTPANWLTQ